MAPRAAPFAALVVAAFALPAAPLPAGDLPVLVSASVAPVPYGARAAGVVLLAVDVDAQGRPGEVRTLKEVAPFGTELRESVRGWSFEPAREGNRAAPTKVLVVGVFRPAMLLFPRPPVPARPERPEDADVPFPASIAVPPYPPNAVGEAFVVVEATVDADGSVTDARVVGEASGFDGAALETARAWGFEPARRDGRPVPGRVCFVFAFRQPV